MSGYLGDFTTSNTAYVYFNTFDSNDPSASVTLTGLAVGDIKIYKNGSVTERSSTSGYTLLDTDGIDFDGNTGIHGFSIDLSDNTDAGFFAAGGEYTIVVASVTVDAATVNFVAGSFSIERTGGALALLKGTNSLADIEGKIDTLTTNLATVDTVVDGIQTDLSNGTDGLGAIKTAVDAIPTSNPTAAAIADAVWDETLTAHVTADSAAVAVKDILVDTAQIGAAGAGLTAIPWNASWDAEVQSECADALTAYDPPTKAELDSGLAALNDLDTAGVATAVWNAATATYGSAGSYGLLVETNLDAQVSSASAPTAAAVADAVWDEAIAGHLGAGSTGEALNAAGAAGDPWTTTLPGAYGAGSAGYIIGNNLDAPISTVDTVVDGIQTDLSNGTDGLGAIKAAVDAIPTSNPTAAAIADAVLDEALAGHVTAGTLGKAVADIESDATAILADTNELQTDDIPGTLATLATAAALATVDSNVDAILVDTGTTLPAQINSVPTATENADALLNRDMSAVSDTTARSPLNALRFIRNKYSISGTTLTVTKEDDTTSAWTATLTTDAAAEPVTGSDPA